MIIDDKEKMRRFNEEWDRAHSTADTTPPIEVGNNNSADSLLESISAQGMSQPVGTYNPPPIPTTGDRCEQCKTLHPPLKPGEKCPVAAELEQQNPQPVHQAPQVPASEPHQTQPAHQPLTEGNMKTNVKPVNETPQRPVAPPPPPQPSTPPAQPEPAPLAQNNIPSEIHINKYLKLWSDMLEAHIKTHEVKNVKGLLRHITVDIDELLGWYKGR